MGRVMMEFLPNPYIEGPPPTLAAEEWKLYYLFIAMDFTT
jgi:hypothetical protein